MAIKIQDQTIIDDNQNIGVTGTVTATDYFLPDGSSIADGSSITVGENEFVAKGDIPNGYACIINNDGTVSVVGQSPGAGAGVSFEPGVTGDISAAYDPLTNKVVIAYRDQGESNRGHAVVGTVSGSNITFGPISLFNGGSTYHISASYLNGKIVVAYSDWGNSGYGRVRVGTIDEGTNTIQWGTIVTFNNGSTSFIKNFSEAVVDGKLLIAYSNGSNNNYGTIIVGTLGGTSVNPIVNFGSPTIFASSYCTDIDLTFDSANLRAVIAYQDGGNNYHGTVAIGTINGTTITIASSNVFESAYVYNIKTIFDPGTSKVVIAYGDGMTGQAKLIIGTVAADLISFGTPIVWNSVSTYQVSLAYDSINGKIIIAYTDEVNSATKKHGKAIIGTVSGTSITLGTPTVWHSTGQCEFLATAYDFVNQKTVIAYQDGGNSFRGTSVVFSTLITNLTAEGYIGIAAEAISDGETGKITTASGINSEQSGLTIGRQYYVQADGSIGLTPDNPPVFAGTSISSTEIIHFSPIVETLDSVINRGNTTANDIDTSGSVIANEIKIKVDPDSFLNDHTPRFTMPLANANSQIFIGDKESKDTLNLTNFTNFGIFIGRKTKNLNQLSYLPSSFNVVIGEQVHNNSNFGRINESVIVGYKAAKEVHDNHRSVFIGCLAGFGQETSINTGYGGYGGYSGSTTITQPESASYCTYVGYKAGFDHTNGQNNICIGYNSGTASSPSGAIGTSSHTIVLGNSSIQKFYCADTSISSSDGRDKTDVEDFTAGLTFIESLRPVTYRWDKRSWYMPETEEGTEEFEKIDSDLSVLDMTPDGTHKREKLHVGFIAQEMEAVEKAHGYANNKKDQLIVDLNEDNTAYGIKYERLVPVLVNAIKELKQEINDLKAQLN